MMDFIKLELGMILNKKWNFMTSSNLVLDEINVHQNYIATLWVIDISHIIQ